jgi:hypothetical protein
MHTSNFFVDGEELYVHHNGDFSGDIRIGVSGRGLEYFITWGDDLRCTEITLPFELLKQIVAMYVQEAKISQLEDLESADDILGVKRGPG